MAHLTSKIPKRKVSFAHLPEDDSMDAFKSLDFQDSRKIKKRSNSFDFGYSRVNSYAHNSKESSCKYGHFITENVVRTASDVRFDDDNFFNQSCDMIPNTHNGTLIFSFFFFFFLYPC